MNVGGGEHPFDRLQFDVLWETSDVYFEVFGGPARLSVRGEASGPEPWQRATFDRFRSQEVSLRLRVLEALLAYYLSIVHDRRAQFEPDFLHLAPLISDVSELPRVVRPEAVYIGDLYPEDENEVDLLYQCTWDESHGLAVRIVNGEVRGVGPQDICL